MFLNQIKRMLSIAVLFWMIAYYIQYILGGFDERILLKVWSITFRRINRDFIFWLSCRVVAWIFGYLEMLHIDYVYSIYSYIRHRSFARLFFGKYMLVCGYIVIYMCVGTLSMALYNSLTTGAVNVMEMLFRWDLFEVLVREGVDCLLVSIIGYIIYILCRNAEAGLLISMLGRIILMLVMKGKQIDVYATLFWGMSVTAAGYILSRMYFFNGMDKN